MRSGTISVTAPIMCDKIEVNKKINKKSTLMCQINEET